MLHKVTPSPHKVTPSGLSLLFLGSFQHYSAIVLSALSKTKSLNITGVVTTPPHPTGRDKKLTKNPTHTLAEKLSIPVLMPNKLRNPDGKKPDLLLTAGYGKLLPPSWLEWPKLGALNLHFSLLPKYRGANPAEWAVLMGEKETGVSVIEMSPEFDTGDIIAKAKTKISKTDTRETLYEKLYTLGGDVLPDVIEKYLGWKNPDLKTINQPSASSTQLFLPPLHQEKKLEPYARRLKRQDGFIPWEVINQALGNQTNHQTNNKQTLLTEITTLLKNTENKNNHSTPVLIERAVRALAGFPGVWTKIPTEKGEKRLKILSAHLEKLGEKQKLVLDKIQLEGKNPGKWSGQLLKP